MMPAPSSLPTAFEIGWRFDNSYARLPSRFFARVPPTPVADPKLVLLNTELAQQLELRFDALSDQEAAALFSGNSLPPQSEPIAQAYAGHQYGHFTMLGDGRALLIGEQINSRGERFDLQFKGSGPTPFSRRGDGRAAIGPMLREYILSEAMNAMGIPTTRSLAVVTTGESVYRETPLPGAILTRVASSHLRVGTFELLAARQDFEGLKTLADYSIARHFPEVQDSDQPYLDFLKIVVDRQAALVAQWLHVGFIHGVMNSDNMAISGETIDYGPCAFMDQYHPSTVFSSIDQHGRYAYANQPRIAHWNLMRLAESLLQLLHPDTDRAISMANEALTGFPTQFEEYWLSGMRKKLGLIEEEAEDRELIDQLLSNMQEEQADFTNTFRNLIQSVMRRISSRSPNLEILEGRDDIPSEAHSWNERWMARLARSGHPLEESVDLMKQVNPSVIPRNHRVEEALKAASDEANYSLVEQLLNVVKRPFDDRPDDDAYRSPPTPAERVCQTFCGT